MAEMDRFGWERAVTFIFVPARNRLDEGVFGVGYVPILGFELFGRFDCHFGFSVISRRISEISVISEKLGGSRSNLGGSRAPVFGKFKSSSDILAIRN